MTGWGKVVPLRRPPAPAAAGPDELSDRALLAACATGDSAALGTLFDRHHRAVYAFLARLAGADRRDLDDLVQITFLEALRSARGYRGEAEACSWLLGIAANVVRRHVRTEVRRKAFTGRLAELPRRAPTEPSGTVERSQLLEKVQQAVADLPHKQRVVYLMCEVEEMSGVEVARVTGLREGTVWRLLHDARKALRAAIEQETP